MVVTSTAPPRPATGRPAQRSSDAKVPLSLLAVAAYLAALWWLAPRSSEFAVTTSARIAIVGMVLAFAAVAGMGRGRWLGAGGVYLIVFSLFHLGLAPMLALGQDVPDFDNRGRVPWWIENRPVGPALFAVSVGIGAYALGLRIGNRLGARSRLRSSGPVIDSHDERRAAAMALALTAVGVLGWIAFTVSRGGIGIFLSSYADYREATEEGLLPILYLLISLGVALCAVAPDHKWSRWGFRLVGLFAFLAALLGLRGEILFPAAAAVVVLSRRGRLRPDPRRWILLAIVLLSVISMVRSVRASGLSDIDLATVDANPLHGAVELGHSLRPVAEVIEWQSSFAEPAGGRTYLRPVERLAAKALPIAIPAASEDPYIMNVVMKQRVGSIGFSPVAEGYENWGLPGAFNYMLVVGMLLGYLDRRRATVSALVATVVVLVPLLIQIRNSFVPVPLNLVLGTLVWAAVFRPRRNGADERRQPTVARVTSRPRAGSFASP